MSTQLQPVDILSPGGNINSYIQSVNAIPVLSADEERELSEQLYFDNNLEAARRLVMSHMRFVVHIARSYSGYGLNQGDLIQEGNVGLMKAVRRFDPTKGVRLVSFAVHWIKAEIHEFILRNWRIVKVATTKAQRKLFFNLRGAKKSLSWLSKDEAQAVADDLGVTLKDVQQMEGRLASIDQTFEAQDDEDYSAPMNYLEDRSADPALLVESENTVQDESDRLMFALSALDERSQDILRSRWLAEPKATLHDLADRYGVSAERIRQLEKNAFKKVKACLEA